MDIQAKLFFEIGVLNGEFTQTEVRYIDNIHYPDGDLGDELIRFNEYSSVKLTFESDDEDALLEIEAMGSDGFAKVKPGETIVIASGADVDDMMVPGFHAVVVKNSNMVYKGLYRIEPSSMSYEGLLNMREYLESIVEGLSRNLYIQRTGDGLGGNGLWEVYSYIKNNEDILISSIDSLIKNPKLSFQKKYKEQFYSRKPDMKSQRWLSLKGMSLNRNIYMPEITYEKHGVLYEDIEENKWVKKIIHYTVGVLCELEKKYKDIQSNIEGRKSAKFKEADKEEKEYNIILGSYTISESFKNAKKKRIEILKKDISELEKQCSTIENMLVDVKRLRSILSKSGYETWLKDIRGFEKVIKPSLGLIRDYRYFKLYEFYKRLILMENDEWSHKKKSFPYKRTSKLFEYYTVMLIINMLQKNGFVWHKGWLADEANIRSYNGELPSETTMIFMKNSLRLELVYDKEVERYSGTKSLGDFVKNNSRNCRPDIRLALFDDNTKRLLNSIIVEVKCRKAKYLYDNNGDTAVIEQLKDYYNFGYHNPITGKVDRGIIGSVIVVYPRQANKIVYDEGYNFSFIQIDPRAKIEETYGYGELEDKLKELLI